MLNSGRRGKRSADGYGIISVNEKFNQTDYPVPIINSYAVTDGSYNPQIDQALDTAGGQTVVIYGSGFKSGATVSLNGSNIGVVTLLDQGRLAITAPALSSGSYTIYVSNTNGATAIYVPGLVYSGKPTWSTTAGSIGSLYETKPVSQTFVATGDTPLSYEIVSGSLPSGTTLSSSGSLSGTLPADSGSTTYSFTIRATDPQYQTSDRSFSLTVNTDVVTWVTPSANFVISGYEYGPVSSTISATDAAGYGILYSANTLPAGITLNANTGVISGSNNLVANTGTRLTATANTTSRFSTRDGIIQIAQDVVTWSTPADQTAYTVVGGQVMANVSLAATTASGQTVSFSANTLPTGVNLSGATIYGTPTTGGTTYTLLTATSANSNRTATRNIIWTVSLGDTNWKYTALALNAVTPTTTFINDASNNNTQLTVIGDTRPSNFNPYQQGYYSNYFDGSNYAVIPVTAFGTGNWTIEGWVKLDGGIDWNAGIFHLSDTGYLPSNGTGVAFATYNGLWHTYNNGGSNVQQATPVPKMYRWTHFAFVKNNNVATLYIDGVVCQTGADTTNYTATYLALGAYYSSAYKNKFYLSNFRIVNGTAVYTSTFTPPTQALTSIANTSFLCANDNRIIDNGPYNRTITQQTAITVDSFHPFEKPTTTSYNNQYSTKFDGSGDYLTVPTTSSLDFGSGDFTVEAWVYPNSLASDWFITSASGSGGFFFGFTSSSTVGYGWGRTGVAWDYRVASTATVGTWQHVAVTRSGTDMRLFVNGEQKGTTQTLSTSYNLGTTSTTIGSQGTNYYLNGNISNLRVLKGTALYTTNFTPSTTPLTAVSGTSLLTCQDPTFKDNSTNAFTITVVADAKPVAVSPFTMTTANNTITSLGSTYFDGTGDYLNNLTTPFKFTGDFTVEAWVYPTSYPGSNNTVMSIWSSSLGFIFKVVTGNRISFYGYPGTTIGCVATSTTVDLNKWTHVAATRVGTTVSLYVNGIKDASTATMSGSFTGTTDITIGSLGTIELWNGWIADARIVSGTALYTSNFLPPQAPLTPVANTTLLTCQTNGGATNNKVIDQSGVNNVITRFGNATQGTFSPYSQTGWSTYFNGSSDYFYSSGGTGAGGAPFGYGTEDFTWECWILPTSTSWTTGNFYIFDHGSNGGVLQYNGNVLRYYNGSTAYDSASGLIPVGQWAHVAVSRVSGMTTTYVNGVVAKAATSDTNNYGTSQQFWVGRYGGGGQYFPGYMSNLRIVKGVGVYTGTFTPPTAPLTAIQGASTNISAISAGQTSLLTFQDSRFVNNSSVRLSFDGGTTFGLSGTPSIRAFGPFGGLTSVPTSYSTYFDGNGDYLQFASNTAFGLGTADFTIEFWVYPTVNARQDWVDIYNGSQRAITYYDGSVIRFYSDTNLIAGPAMTLNTWQHVAVSRQSNNIKMFINGSQVGTTYSTTKDFGSSSSVYIGKDSVGSTYVTGYLSNVRIIKGTALYTANNTPSTTPLTTTSQGATASQVSLLTCQSTTMNDNSTNKFTVTAYGDTRPSTFTPFGTTNTTNVSYTPSVNGGSIYFDGSGDYLTVPSSSNYNFGTGDFTVEFWAYPTVNARQDWVDISNGSARLLVYYSGTSIIYYQGTALISGGAPLFNSWNHIVVCRSAGVSKLFINGIQTNTGTIDSTNYPTQPISIGKDSGGSTYVTGYMSDIRIIPFAVYTSNFIPPTAPLTASAAVGKNTYASTLLLNGTSGGMIDYHSTNVLETVGNVQMASEDPYSGSYYSNYFDGTGDYLTTATVPSFGTGDFTIEGWVYNTGTVTNSGVFQLSSGAFGGTAGLAAAFYTAAGGWQTYYGSGSTQGATITLTVNTWYHFAITRSGTSLKTFINGTVINTITDSTNYALTTLTLGGYYSSSYLLTGYISNFRIVNGTALYTSAFTPPTAPLTAVSGTSVLTCQSNKFIDTSTNALVVTKYGDTKVKSFNPFRQNTGKSFYFDGDTDYLSIPYNPLISQVQPYTLEFWFYPTYNYSGQYIFAQNGGGAFGLNWNGSVMVVDKNGVGTQITGSNTMRLNEWHHFAMTYDGTTTRTFANGVLDGSVSGTGGLAAVASTFAYYAASGSSSFRGYLKDIRFTKSARYTSAFTPPIATFEVK